MRLIVTVAIVGTAGLVAGAVAGLILTLSANDNVLNPVREAVRIGLRNLSPTQASADKSASAPRQLQGAEAMTCRIQDAASADRTVQGRGGCLVRGPKVRLSANRIILDRGTGRVVAEGSVRWLDRQGRLNKADRAELNGETARIVATAFSELALATEAEPETGASQNAAGRLPSTELAVAESQRSDSVSPAQGPDSIGPTVQTPVEGWRVSLPVVRSPRVICGRVVQDGTTGHLVGSDGCVALAAGKGLRADEIQLDITSGKVTARGKAFQWDDSRRPVPIGAAPVMPPLSLAIRRYLLDAERGRERGASLLEYPARRPDRSHHLLAGR